jgi:hypothetical protein
MKSAELRGYAEAAYGCGDWLAGAEYMRLARIAAEEEDAEAEARPERSEVVEHFVREWKASGEWDLVVRAFRAQGFEPTDDDVVDALKDIYLDIWAYEASLSK